jgi:predicted HAD superfamily phosphohydrolase YqeG
LFFVVLLAHLLKTNDFDNFLIEFKKSYSTTEEYTFLKPIFDANYTLIVETNLLNLGYILAVKEMND